jgi:hypothetical protein
MKKFLSLGAALAMIALCSPVAAIDQEDTCESRESAWLAANSAKLPHNFTEIMALPADERLVAFRNVDAATQSAIWQGHYDSFLAAEGESLTPAQRELVLRARFAVTPELYSQREGQPGFAAAQAPLRQVVADAQAHFSQEQIRSLFYQLGGESKSSSKPTQRLVPYCSCADNWDCGGSFCRSALCVGHQGCGPNYTEGCWGRC